MSAPEGFVDIGVRLDLLILGWLGVGLILLGVLLALADWFFEWHEFGFMLGGLSALFGALMGITWLIFMVPFDSTYQHIYRVEGHVTSVSNVLAEADGDLTRQPVITLDTVDQPIVIDDSRAVKLEGQDVVLRCSINWEYQAADKYECKIIEFAAEASR